MPSFLFRSRWIALVWVAGVLVSVGSVFGEGGLDDLAASIRARKQAVEKPVQNPPIVIPAPSPPQVDIPGIDVGSDGEPLIGPGLGETRAGAEVRESAQDRDDGDSYVVLDGAAEVEEATDEDLRFDRRRDREDQSSSSPPGPSMPSSSSSLRSPL